ncbi:hypothetical protein QGN32_02190 [Mycolicibacterium sp. ND9-15]|uniref:hypothetical protein n=1 Tax=Mycolicibacterium sp. ND9-15 TaxID=3042320 RepID=UPI002DD9AEA5|nr:hypothetical protein [Mycolicibacterium sp. ND9-15]WSE56760.1 hypothetical protein QGN32_02190 [Mycolicibacterium sp. ND9-15]
MTEPQPQHLQRASRAYKEACGLCLYACEVYHGRGMPGEDRLPLEDLGFCVPDVLDALVSMLQLQMGQAVTVALPPGEDGVWELAELVAANANFDEAMFRAATRAGDGREQFWRVIADAEPPA